MIYKFIDDHGTEITVNSLSQLQTLVESQTIKKNTKVKAGLRGEWEKAKDVNELKFEEAKKEEPPKALEDIESFITSEPTPPPKKETITKTEKQKIDIKTPIKTEEIIERTKIKKQPEKVQAKKENVVSTEIEREITNIDYKDQKATDKSEEINKTDKQTINLGTIKNHYIVLFFKKLWQGKYSLKLSFWGLYLLPNLLFSILFLNNLSNVLKAEAPLVSVLFYVATFAVIIYLIVSMLGTWKSANQYRNYRKIENKPYGLGITAQIFVSADILIRIIGTARQFI